MLIESLKEEMLALLRKMKARKWWKGKENSKRRKRAFPPKFEKEFMMECLLNYNVVGRRVSVNGKGGWEWLV